MRNLLLTLLLSFSWVFAAAQSQLHFVNFESDQYTLSAEAIAYLDEVIQTIPNNNPAQIRITGHTDADGSDAYNEQLSKRRANAVKEYLVRQDIPVERIEIDWVGESNPVATNEKPDGKSKNRRVEIAVEVQPTDEYSDWRITEAEWEAMFALPVQNFEVIPGKEAVFRTLAGNYLTFPASAFAHLKYHEEPVRIYFKEAMTLGEMAIMQLSTMTKDHQALLSAGMFEVRAFFEDNSLPDGEFQIIVPTDQTSAAMEAFSGSFDEQGQMGWVGNGRLAIVNSFRPISYSPYRCGDIKCRFLFCGIFEVIGLEHPSSRRLAECRANKERHKFSIDSANTAGMQRLQAELLADVSNYPFLTEENVQAYILTQSISSMGWANIDQYLKDPEKLLVQQVKLPKGMDQMTTRMAIEANGLVALFYPRADGQNLKFSSVLKDAKVTVFSYGLIDGVPHAVFQPITPTTETIELPEPEPMPWNDLYAKLKQLRAGMVM